MAIGRLTFVLLVQCIFLVNVYSDNDFRDNSDEYYRPQILCLVNYLNADPNRDYNYNYGTLISAQNKEQDNTELTIDVEIECRNPRLRCVNEILECSGTVRYNTDTANYEVVPGANCNTKPAYVSEDTDTIEDPTPSEGLPVSEAGLATEAAEPIQEEEYVQKTIPLLGGPTDLNLNIEGLDVLTNMALKHIQSERNNKPALVKILRVQRQVVSGVKYILTLEVAETNCDKNIPTTSTCSIVAETSPEICEIIYYQQPWISRKKNIISNNCTSSQEFTTFDDQTSAANDEDNEIDTNFAPKKSYTQPEPESQDNIPNYDVIADMGNAEDMLKISGIDASRLRELESQIIQVATEEAITEEVTEEEDMAEQEREKRAAKDDDSSSSSSSSSEEDDKKKKHDNNDDDDDDDDDNNNNDKKYEKTKRKYKKYNKNNDDDDDDDDDDDNNTNNIKNNKKDDSSSSSSSSSSSEEDNNTDKKPKNKKKNKREVTDNSNSSESSEEKDAPVTTQSSTTVANNEENNIQNDASSSSEEHKGKQKRDVSTQYEEYKRMKRGGGAGRLAGGITTVDPEDEKIKEYAQSVLQQLDAHEGLGATRVLIKMLSASRQVVSGTLYRFKAEMTKNGKATICEIEVWDQPWLKEEQKKVSIKCDNDVEQKKYKFKRSIKYDLLGKDDHDVHLSLFKDFMRKHRKQYSSKIEFKNRFRIFTENMKTVRALNDNEQGTAKYGPTMFSDLNRKEFESYLGLKPNLKNPNNIPAPQANIPNDFEAPTEFDWRSKGVISEVKNQGSCGSCWAFSVTGNIEGLNAIKTGKLLELSEQELVDCDKLDSGCSGGLPDNAYRAIEEIGGLETETDYPYDAEDEKCHFNQSLSKVQISGSVNISSDETDMMKWLVKNGPISIGINANAMQFYMGGVSHPWKFMCNPKNLDHGVLIVGYGIHKYPLFKKELPYWTIKNSWGPTWGEQGYYRVYRGDGTCGVNQMASSAVL